MFPVVILYLILSFDYEIYIRLLNCDMFPVGSSSGSSRDSRMSISSQDSVYHSSDTDSDVSHVIMVTISLDIAERYHNLNRTRFIFPSFLSREDKF